MLKKPFQIGWVSIPEVVKRTKSYESTSLHKELEVSPGTYPLFMRESQISGDIHFYSIVAEATIVSEYIREGNNAVSANGTNVSIGAKEILSIPIRFPFAEIALGGKRIPVSFELECEFANIGEKNIVIDRNSSVYGQSIRNEIAESLREAIKGCRRIMPKTMANLESCGWLSNKVLLKMFDSGAFSSQMMTALDGGHKFMNEDVGEVVITLLDLNDMITYRTGKDYVENGLIISQLVEAIDFPKFSLSSKKLVLRGFNKLIEQKLINAKSDESFLNRLTFTTAPDYGVKSAITE